MADFDFDEYLRSWEGREPERFVPPRSRRSRGGGFWGDLLSGQIPLVFGGERVENPQEFITQRPEIFGPIFGPQGFAFGGGGYQTPYRGGYRQDLRPMGPTTPEEEFEWNRYRNQVTAQERGAQVIPMKPRSLAEWERRERQRYGGGFGGGFGGQPGRLPTSAAEARQLFGEGGPYGPQATGGGRFAPSLARDLAEANWWRRIMQQQELTGAQEETLAWMKDQLRQRTGLAAQSLANRPFAMQPQQSERWGGPQGGAGPNRVLDWGAAMTQGLRGQMGQGRVPADWVTPGMQTGQQMFDVGPFFGFGKPGYNEFQPGEMRMPATFWQQGEGARMVAVPRGMEDVAANWGYPRQNIISIDIGKDIGQMRQEVLRAALPHPDELYHLPSETRVRLGLSGSGPQDPYERAMEWISTLGYEGKYVPDPDAPGHVKEVIKAAKAEKAAKEEEEKK